MFFLTAQEPNLAKDATVITQPGLRTPWRYKRWLLVALYTLFILSGQSVATLLGRVYYDKGGNSKWLATILLTAGFPILLPFFLFFSFSNPLIPNATTTTNNNTPSVTILISLYVSLGILFAGDNLMYSYGLLYLPVSTYSLICATQLAFNAFFSFFLNSLKFTPILLNSLVLLTISASLLAVHTESTGLTGVATGKYVIGFVCTLGASAMYAFLLSLTQLSFEKILKKETYSVILEMLIYPSIVATGVCVVGLFASGEWSGIKGEMEQFGGGKLSYVMTLVWTAVAWQVFSIGSLGLIFEVSSLFCNVISTVSLPV